MTPEDLFRELKDIDLPAEPGWWLMSTFSQLVVALSIGLIAVFWFYKNRQRKNRRTLEARRNLSRIRIEYRQQADARQTLVSLSAWLKQVAMAAFPDQGVAPLTGRAWTDFLQQTTPKPIFNSEQQRLFSSEVYRRQVDCDLDPVIDACERWLIEIDESLKQGTSA